jgi:hypothetical protein
METYKLISVKEFLQMRINEVKKTVINGALPGFTPDPKTEIRFITQDYYGFEYYEFKHEMLFKETGIAFGYISGNPQSMEFTDYLKEYAIKCFCNRKDNYAFLTSASYVINDLMKICKKNDDLGVELDEISLDMPSLFQYAPDFLGAWFHGVSNRVTSSALFGSDLANEPLYQQLTNDGASLTSVTIPYRNFRMQLNEKAGISTKHLFDNINEELQLVQSLKDEIIDRIRIVE